MKLYSYTLDSVVTVTATANDDGAEVEIMPEDADDATDAHEVELNDAGMDTEITVTVTAEDGTTTMDYTVTVTRSDGHQAPSAPTNLEVTPANQQATLTWGAPRQIGSTAIAGYEWEAAAPGQLTQSGTTDGTTLTDDVTGLVNGATYTFSVYARNRAGAGGRGPAATVTGKAQPQITLALSTTTLTEATPATDSILASVSVNAASIEDITVTVADTLATVNGRQVTIAGGTIVIPAGELAGADTAVIKAIDDDVDEEADADAPAGASIEATSANAVDAAAQAVTITDNDEVSGAPALTVRAGNAQLNLEWVSPANTGTSPITHYEVRHSTDALDEDDEWTTVAGGAGARTVVIGNLANGTTVNVEVRAVSAAGNGAAASGSATPTA